MKTRFTSPPVHSARLAKRVGAAFTAASLALGLGVGEAVVASSEAAAQDIQRTGPLAGAPAVEHLRQYRAGRFEIAPMATFSLLDEYRRTILFGARLQYNVTDWLGLGVWGGFGAVSLPTNLSDQIDKIAPRNDRTATNLPPAGAKFENQTAKIAFVAVPQLTLVPFRGKLSLFKTIFVDTDVNIHVGAAFVGLNERPTCGGKGEKACNDPASFATASRMAIAPSFGLGLTFYPSSLVSFGFEYRAIPFAWNRSGFDTRGAGSNGDSPDQKLTSDDRTLKLNQMFSVFVGFSLGEVKISPGTEAKGTGNEGSGDAAPPASSKASK